MGGAKKYSPPSNLTHPPKEKLTPPRLPAQSGFQSCCIVASSADPTGVGEPGVPPLAPAVADALAKLGGQRVRRLPLARSGLIET